MQAANGALVGAMVCVCGFSYGAAGFHASGPQPENQVALLKPGPQCDVSTASGSQYPG